MPINSFAVILREKKKSCIEEVDIIFFVFENRFLLGLENLGINYEGFCFVLSLCNLILFTKNKRLITVLEFWIYELLEKIPKWVHMEKKQYW